MKISFIILLTFLTQLAFAHDLSTTFFNHYQKDSKLTVKEINNFKNYNFVLIPGILSEMFIRDDNRTAINVWFLTGSYFGETDTLLKKTGFESKRLAASSKSVEETRELIRTSIRSSSKKTIFITHSLGGVTLLDSLVAEEDLQASVAGILFLQSPFYGSPIADVFLSNNKIHKWVKPLMPFLNTSMETVIYLSSKERIKYMQKFAPQISELTSKIPMLILSTVANDVPSIFGTSVDIMKVGCVQGLVTKKCITKKLYDGPYDDSDGMVPYKSSKLDGVDFVRIEGMDHGEPVMKIPFDSYKTKPMVLSLLKMLHSKLHP